MDMLSARDHGVPDRGPRLLAVNITLPIVAAFFVAARLSTKMVKSKRLGLDDYFIVVSLMFAIWVSCMDGTAVHHGFGKHMADMTPQAHVQAMKVFFYLAQIPYKTGVCFTKCSILLLYLRIFPSRRFRYTVYATMIFVVAYSISFVFLTIFQCTPIPRAYDKKIPGHCVDNMGQWYSYAVVNIVSDFWILFLPLPSISKLKLPLPQKIGLMGVFALGAFVCVVSIVRVVSMSPEFKTGDLTWGAVDATMWTDIEDNTGIICACLPMLKAPISRVFPHLFGGNNKTSTNGPPGSYGMGHMPSSHHYRTHPSRFHTLDDDKFWDGTQTGDVGVTDVRYEAPSPEEHSGGNSGRESQERIMGEAADAGITKTTVVTVSYDDNESTGPASAREHGNIV
ncbi:MAG: hypothetical protein M1819_000252 [Sarea resinae]|nr:MAG: hypothetical protein M1819_000252 [Sarea resinae]